MVADINDAMYYRSGQTWDVTWTGSDTKSEVKSKRCLKVFAKMYVITTLTTTLLPLRVTRYSLIYFGSRL